MNAEVSCPPSSAPDTPVGFCHEPIEVSVNGKRYRLVEIEEDRKGPYVEKKEISPYSLDHVSNWWPG